MAPLHGLGSRNEQKRERWLISRVRGSASCLGMPLACDWLPADAANTHLPAMMDCVSSNYEPKSTVLKLHLSEELCPNYNLKWLRQWQNWERYGLEAGLDNGAAAHPPNPMNDWQLSPLAQFLLSWNWVMYREQVITKQVCLSGFVSSSHTQLLSGFSVLLGEAHVYLQKPSICWCHVLELSNL